MGARLHSSSHRIKPSTWPARTQRDIRQVLERYFPFILDHLDDPPLAHALAMLNQKEHYWQNQIIVNQEVAAGDQYGASLDSLEAAKGVYDLWLE